MVEEWQLATLAEKIPPQALKQGSHFLRNNLVKQAKGLNVESEFSLEGYWLHIRAKGEDADAFLNLLRQEYGEPPISRSKLEKWDVVNGFVTGAGRIGYGVYIDIGIQEPAPKDALYPLHRKGEKISVELNDEARDRLVSWRKYPFDRVIVVGADKTQAETAVRAAGLQSDIVKVESLSLFVQSLLCKIGTDAPGVIAKIGNRLRGVGLSSYRTPVKL